MRDRIERAADTVLGSRFFTSVADRIMSERLRILAYHEVHDVDSFRRQMEYVRARYHPVSSDDVVDWLEKDQPLPRRPVWVTFDDGDPSVVTQALPILQEVEIRGTMFVCPGVVDTDEPFWWEVVEAARRDDALPDGLSGSPLPAVLRKLKMLPDRERRDLVAKMRTEFPARGRDNIPRQIKLTTLRSFIEGGGTIGNHTWDHPCLDTCTIDEQMTQIRTAHEWLAENLEPTRLFAYPNGNHSYASEAALRQLGYAVGLLFDHRMAGRHVSPLRLSRLRVNDYSTLRRFAAILAGGHGATVHLRVGSGAKP